MSIKRFAKRLLATAAATVALTLAAFAQVTPAAGYTPPDDTPKFSVGAVIYGDYTYADSPQTKDADGNAIHSSAFNLSRAYINLTGNLNHYLSFRITPDIARETNATPALSGSEIFRLKYAYAQIGLDDWMSKGSWVRFGTQQTPYIDYTEAIYRYRFQGTTFTDRLGLYPSSDFGVSGHYAFADNYGDIHAGLYNGEGYNKAETNNEKAFQVRATVRPFPLGGELLKGLRFTVFVDEDHYVESAKRQRTIGQITYEHPLVTVGLEDFGAKDRLSVTKAEVDSKGYSLWATPKFGKSGWELLLRHDEYTPVKSVSSQKQKRDIDGVAYWFPNTGSKSMAVLFDRDSLKKTGLTPAAANATNYELKMLVSF
jgi:hypothetical protein